PMQHDRMQPRIEGQHFPARTGRGVAVEDALDVGTQPGEHAGCCYIDMGLAVYYRGPLLTADGVLPGASGFVASAMALAMARWRWISSCVGCARLNSCCRRGISFLGACGSRKPICTSERSQWSSMPATACASAARTGAVASRTAKPPSA